MLEILDSIQITSNSTVVEHELLNYNCLYIKTVENSMVQIKAGYYINPLTNKFQVDEIYNYPVVDEDNYLIETTEFGIAVYKEELEERKIVALYDAKNNQKVKCLYPSQYNQFIMYYNSLEEIKQLSKNMKVEL